MVEKGNESEENMEQAGKGSGNTEIGKTRESTETKRDQTERETNYTYLFEFSRFRLRRT